MDQLVKHAATAASAHGVWSNVSVIDEMIDDRFTGNVVVTVEIFQDVYYAPEGQAPSQINNRRLIGISRGDAKRLYESRRGRPGGQVYSGSRTARREFSAVAGRISQAVTALMEQARSGAFRAAAYAVADEAGQIEVEMRQQLRHDLAALPNPNF